MLNENKRLRFDERLECVVKAWNESILGIQQIIAILTDIQASGANQSKVKACQDNVVLFESLRDYAEGLLVPQKQRS